jgi:uncharacterized protein YgiB involved in biofilm formation
MRQRARKRSAAITLVLAGSATLSGCGSPVEQRDAYTNLESCTRDWNNPAMCEPVRDNRYPTSFFYGPPYYGNGTTYSMFGRTRSPAIQPSPNAAETYRVQTGTVATSPRAQQAMTMGLGPRTRSASSSGSSSTSVSRGGFGSTGASSSSSSSSS